MAGTKTPAGSKTPAGNNRSRARRRTPAPTSPLNGHLTTLQFAIAVITILGAFLTWVVVPFSAMRDDVRDTKTAVAHIPDMAKRLDVDDTRLAVFDQVKSQHEEELQAIRSQQDKQEAQISGLSGQLTMINGTLQG